MRHLDQGVLLRGGSGTDRATFTFPTLLFTSSGTLLATLRAGSTKDSADERIETIHSSDRGRSWSEPAIPFAPLAVGGHAGSLKHCYLSEIAPRRILGAAMWVDRTQHPGQPLFNPQTEGCLPMAIALCESRDDGRSFGDWWVVPLPEEIGPPSLTSPILRLADGRLAMSIETNKTYFDTSPWRQKAVFVYSDDLGATWSEPQSVAEDPDGRLFNWDLRCNVAPDGTVATFAWTYDNQEKVYLDIQRRISRDNGRSWSAPVALGFADQAGRPAILADGRIVLPFVDRFGSHTIKARMAASVDAAFTPDSEVLLFDPIAGASGRISGTGALLADMEVWSFGLPFAEAIGENEVMVVYYAGNARDLDIRYAILSV